MGTTRDAEATQKRILDAARKEFAAKGIAGARVDEIAARARTNKRMIYYYFGSKEGLFREILRRKLADSTNRLRAPVERPHGERLADRQATHLDDPDYIRLLMWEALETGTSRRRKPLVAEEERAAVYQAFRESIAAEQAAGRLPADLDPGQLALTELALTIIPAAFPQLVPLITGKAVNDPAFLEERQEFLRRLADHLSAAGVESPTV